MKRILFFMTLFCVSLSALAQNEFTGDGDGYSWEDPYNWSYLDVPQDGDDILIDGYFVYYGGFSFYQYESLELTNSANLFVQGDIYLMGDLIVDASSTVELYIYEIDIYTKIYCNYYFFNGNMVINMPGFAPQIGDTFNIIEGDQGSCGTATTLFVPENQTSGIEVTFGVECEYDGIYYTVTGVNYSTAKAWDGEGGDGQWNTAANWAPNGVPMADDIVYINVPGAGGAAYTNGAGVTHVKEIIVGRNNTLGINGDLSVYSGINNNMGGAILWNAGEISKEDINRQCLLINYGSLTLDTSGLKALEDGFEIWAFESDIDHNQGDLNINNGKIMIFNYVNYNINADNITIGYTSGTNHSFDIRGAYGITKTTGSGTSTINLTNLYSNANIISEMGTLAFTEDIIQGANSNFGGSGLIQFPTNFEVNSDISPGSSPGILTIAGDLIAGADTVFNIEIDGPTVDLEYDKLVIQNNADISGTLNIILSYLPPSDAIFEIISAASLNSNNLPETIEADYGGNFVIFNVEAVNNSIYLVGPGATLSVDNLMASETLSVYPNPAKDVINIKMEKLLEGEWHLVNQLGQVVMSGEVTSTETMIPINRLTNGVYFLNIKEKTTNKSIVRKIVIAN
ncbi:T9SS type A sorting domain-containing protein [Xanthomarina sp. F2636L]|uniref:T9SS type A sorting domain-containing protein n=1 Tax=Xanthomarina sp. F2636L TaxID=2996018 RepID=UPI00225E3687|nr:T9SS type A sorting domain-containing protein [Xanthomarina sp. F2636L]MCX7550805.1 T9SS type A sorting domain-containing protein [Xanthomarina sp. F2636L]